MVDVELLDRICLFLFVGFKKKRCFVYVEIIILES